MPLKSSLLVTAVCLLIVVSAMAAEPELDSSLTSQPPRDASAQLAGFRMLSNTPPVPAIELHDESGQALNLQAFRGKVMLLNLWATWCPPCIREMPDLNALQQQYRERGLIVVPVASGRQGKQEPAEFLRQLGLRELATLYDPQSQLLRLFDLQTLPATFVVDRDGNMRGGALGIIDWCSSEALAVIEAFLAE